MFKRIATFLAAAATTAALTLGGATFAPVAIAGLADVLDATPHCAMLVDDAACLDTTHIDDLRTHRAA